MKRIADSTVRRLSAYLRFLEDFEGRGLTTISSEELAKRGGTTSAQVRKDLSFFGSFGKRGLGYSVPELSKQLRDILGLGREWRVVIVGAGKIGAALAQYRGFRQRGFVILRAYDNNPDKIGKTRRGHGGQRHQPDRARLRARAAGHRRACRPRRSGAAHSRSRREGRREGGPQLCADPAPGPADVTVKTVNMAMELESLSFALTNRDG